MTNLLAFPSRDCVIITEGIDCKTGRPVFIMELVNSQDRICVGEYSTLADVTSAVIEWRRDGVEVRA